MTGNNKTEMPETSEMSEPRPASDRRRPQESPATLRLHRRLYPTRAVKAAQAAFSEIADVRLERDGNYHLVRIAVRDAKLDPAEVTHELANYALGRAAEAR